MSMNTGDYDVGLGKLYYDKHPEVQINTDRSLIHAQMLADAPRQAMAGVDVTDEDDEYDDEYRLAHGEGFLLDATWSDARDAWIIELNCPSGKTAVVEQAEVGYDDPPYNALVNLADELAAATGIKRDWISVQDADWHPPAWE